MKSSYYIVPSPYTALKALLLFCCTQTEQLQCVAVYELCFVWCYFSKLSSKKSKQRKNGSFNWKDFLVALEE